MTQGTYGPRVCRDLNGMRYQSLGTRKHGREEDYRSGEGERSE